MTTRTNANGVAAGGRVRLVLVGCGKSKAGEVCAARDLYTGNLYRAARGYAEAEVQDGRATAWFVLSAKHGLLDPTAEVAPYDDRLAAGGARAALWGEAVLDALAARFPGVELELLVLAGAPYVRPLRPALRGWKLADPMRGFQVGERLSWFKAMGEARTLQASVDTARAGAKALLDAEFERAHAEAIQEDVDRWLKPRLENAKKRQVEHVTDARRRRAAKREAAKVVAAPAAPGAPAPALPCSSCGAVAGEPCTTGTGRVRAGLHTPRAKAVAEAEAAERQRAAVAAPRVYIGIDFDRELLPCPVCIGEAKGIKLCCEPMGKVGRNRWRSLDAGHYHRARVPADVLERAERASRELHERLERDRVTRAHVEALAENLERDWHHAILEDGRRGLAKILGSTDVAGAARGAGFSVRYAESLADQRVELAQAHDEALDEDRRRTERPELFVACPKCGAAAGARCRDYRNRKKATCRERLSAPEVLAGNERSRARGRAEHAHPAPAFVDASGTGPAVMRATLQPLDVCTGCEDACGFCPHGARAPAPVALEAGAGGEVIEDAIAPGDCCAEKSGGGVCSWRASALVLVPGLGHVRACSKHAYRHARHQAGEKVRAVKWHSPGSVDVRRHADDRWRVQNRIDEILEHGRHLQRVAARDAAAGQLAFAFAA